MVGMVYEKNMLLVRTIDTVISYTFYFHFYVIYNPTIHNFMDNFCFINVLFSLYLDPMCIMLRSQKCHLLYTYMQKPSPNPRPTRNPVSWRSSKSLLKKILRASDSLIQLLIVDIFLLVSFMEEKHKNKGLHWPLHPKFLIEFRAH